MQIVWDSATVDSLKHSHTVLELETFQTEKGPLTAWCVVPAEKLLADLPNLNNLKQLHQTFLTATKEKNHKLCENCAEHLIGRFGGELDTFYQEILARNK
jgi:hypothetical protein